LLAGMEGWSFSEGFHYHTFMLGLTSVPLGGAEPPVTTSGLLSNMYTTLTGGISSYVVLYIAAMTAVTRNVAELSPDGFFGLVIAIFLYYPPLVACSAHIIGAIMCTVEGWYYLDSFLLACSWLSAVPLKIEGCVISSETSMFIVTLCHMVAVAMKLTVLDTIYYNTFPRKVVNWVDTWVAQEEDAASAEFQVVCQRDLPRLEEECAILEAENERLKQENERLLQRVGALKRASPNGACRALSCFSARGGRSREALRSSAWPTTTYGAASVGPMKKPPKVQQTYPQEPALSTVDCGKLELSDDVKPHFPQVPQMQETV